jgi:hypothetical protein
MQKEARKGFWTFLTRTRHYGVAAAGLFALVLMVGLSGEPRDAALQSATTAQAPAWGTEVLDAIHDSGIVDLLVAPANACGLGASSCFRCHNGTRAAAPPADPWHTDHGRVNNSCVGCHQGNPRLMRQEMSHGGLLADPRTNTAAACSGCHLNASDVEQFVSRYTGN